MKGGHNIDCDRLVKVDITEGVIILLIFLLLTFTGCGYLFMTGPDYPSGMPRYFQADYDMVWNAVLDALDEEGYVIAQMSKADGYITTDRKSPGATGQS